jgi:hypothetical protein
MGSQNGGLSAVLFSFRGIASSMRPGTQNLPTSINCYPCLRSKVSPMCPVWTAGQPLPALREFWSRLGSERRDESRRCRHDCPRHAEYPAAIRRRRGICATGRRCGLGGASGAGWCAG